MRTLLLFLILGSLCCSVTSSPPAPSRVLFSSVNLRNLVRWFPGNGTQDDTHYTVQYAIYGDSVEGSRGRRVNWRAVRHCTEIVRSWCDLTAETWDLEQGYYARVRAVGGRRESSKWAVTRRRFDPKLDTSVGPPLISLEIEDNSVIIHLKGPMRYVHNNQTPGVSMKTIYPQMTYNLSVHNTQRDKTHHFSVVSSPYSYSLTEYDTEYCFSAKTRFLSMPIECQSSEWQCLTTPQDPLIGQLQRVVVGIVVPSLCLCMLMVVGYFLYQYLTGKGQKSPYTLKLHSFNPAPPTFHPENLNLVITVIQDEPPSTRASYNVQRVQIPDPPLGYNPQRLLMPPQLEEDLDDYGSVVEVWGPGGGGDGCDLSGERHKDGESYRSEHRGLEGDLHGRLYAAQAEMSGLVGAHPWSQVNPELLTQPTERSGLCVDEIRLSQIPLNRSTMWEGGMGGGTDRRMDEGEGEGGEGECVFWAYASQSIRHLPNPHAEESDFLSDDYGVLGCSAEEEEEENDGSIRIDWDPETRKVVMPKIEMELIREGSLSGLMHGERGRQDGMGGEEEEEMMKGELRLESVFVRQVSEEEEEERRGLETGAGVDDFMNKWNLVISMDQ